MLFSYDDKFDILRSSLRNKENFTYIEMEPNFLLMISEDADTQDEVIGIQIIGVKDFDIDKLEVITHERIKKLTTVMVKAIKESY